MPFLVIDRIEYGPPEFAELLPLRCDVVRAMTGPDGATYFLVRPEPAPNYFPLVPAPLTPEQEEHYARTAYPRLDSFDLAQVSRQLLQYLPDGRIAVAVPGFIVTPRYPPSRFGPNMRDVWVNLAFVLDPTIVSEPRLDFGKLFFAAITRMNLEQPPEPEPAAPEPVAAPPTPAPAAPLSRRSGPIRYLALLDRMGEPAGYVWVGVDDDRSGMLLPERPMPETAATAHAWIAALRHGAAEGAEPDQVVAELAAATGDVLSGNLVPGALAEATSLLAFSLSIGREMAARNRERAGTVPYGVPPSELPSLMVPTATEQQRVDALLAEAIRTRDAVPPDQRVLNAEPKFNTGFGPAAPQPDQTTASNGDQGR